MTGPGIELDVHALMPLVLHARGKKLRVERNYSMLLIGPITHFRGKESVVSNIHDNSYRYSLFVR